MTIPTVKQVFIGKSDRAKTYAIFADSAPVAMITAWADGVTRVCVDLSEDTIDFLSSFAPQKKGGQ
jgi:hypothetical protein